MAVEQALLALVGAADTGAYQINQSLRFDGSARFSKTFASDGNRKTFTISFWVKNTTTTIGNVFNQSRTNLRLNTTNAAFVLNAGYGSTNAFLTSNASFRDPSAWYHFVLAFDTTQSTASDRVKIWVNNQLQTYSSATYPPQNQDLDYNSTNTAYIGAENTSEYLNGYLAEYYSIDGTALTPSSFGETDTITGAWLPKKYSGSYGTNGFYLKFQSSGVGTDSSGNGNNWTASGFSTSGTGTDVMSDTPTNNYCTMSTLGGLYDPAYSQISSLSDGNLVWAAGSASGNPNTQAVGTVAVSSGKWYFEVTRGAGDSMAIGWATHAPVKGVAPNNIIQVNTKYSTITTFGAFSKSFSNPTLAPANGDIVGIGLDIDNGTLSVWINNTVKLNAGAISGLNAGNYLLFPFVAKEGSEEVGNATLNFGQRAFAYTPPTGYKALNTANLPEPTIKKGSKYFDTVLYTGNGGTQTISGVGFQPDFVWIKDRGTAFSHRLVDVVRGSTEVLFSDSTAATQVDSYGTVDSFTSNGFALRLGTNVVSADGANRNGDAHVAWNWKESATAGFDIVTYTGNGAANQVVNHSLGVTPNFVIVKNRSNSASWNVWGSQGFTRLGLNITNGDLGNYGITRGASSITLPSTSDVGWNSLNENYVAYLWSEVAGYSKFGSYTGNGSSDGPLVFCGFRPAWLLIKRTDSTSDWILQDSKRLGYNVDNNDLIPNQNYAEATDDRLDQLSNGFKLRSTFATSNASGGTYIFAAFSETAFKYANAR